MDLPLQLIVRVIVIFMGVWVGASSVFFAAFLWHGFHRPTRMRRGWVRATCPYCDGRGAVIDRFDEWAVCPMCDGEQELAGPRELDEG